MAGEKILIIDDERDIIQLVTLLLQDERYQVISAESGQQALKLARTEKPDLIILDVFLPDMDGIDVCQELRHFTSVPILFLSCKCDDIDKIVGLRVGGDDYITKPFSPGELIARVKAHLRRSRLPSTINKHNRIYRYPGLEIDVASHEIRLNHSIVNLSAKEFQILAILAQNPSRIFTADHLFQLVWNLEDFTDTRTVAVHISSLRKKIEPDPAKPRYVLTVRGVGYKFNIPQDK
ncbi:response regulator transcription factor [Desulfitibacter alkalitolerans]|uniref:response regulator transcription factor n=1 Tax=Desulfitibacter alkalitolerans TaxID=264641 RepID=UPI0004862B96|nr:response regulator transcription factor [Desulfitibacter alkalitolerans]